MYHNCVLSASNRLEIAIYPILNRLASDASRGLASTGFWAHYCRVAMLHRRVAHRRAVLGRRVESIENIIAQRLGE